MASPYRISWINCLRAHVVLIGLLLGGAMPAAAQSVTRGPYLQIGTPSSVIVKWRTDTATNAAVRYGLDADVLTSSATSATVSIDHEVRLTGLFADTVYYYSVGTTTTTLAGGASYFFVTSPETGTSKPTRVWVLGDSGTANANAAAVRDAYIGFNGSRYTDLMLLLGDNAYNDGTDSEYERAVFDMYPSQLRQTVLWPTLGNHDGHTADSSTQTGPYYDIFTLPRKGQAGGLASGTEAYYSFNFANIHFVCLESYETDRSTNGAMLTWLRSDLAANDQPWVIAYWHHPPYTKGSHDSDNEIELIQMRENALPILEDYGVDLVLTGHSHSYERSFLLDGHYAVSSTFLSSMKKDGGNGRTDGTGAYTKRDAINAPHEGAVYAVAGSSGQVSGGSLNHPAMYISLNALGSMVLDINGDTLDARFLDNAGVTRDYFTITKELDAPGPPSLVAVQTAANPVTVAWSAGPGGLPTSHTVAVGSTPGATDLLVANVGTQTQISGNAPGSRVYIRVIALNAAGQAISNEISILVGGLSSPGQPIFTGQSVANGVVSLSWAPPGGGLPSHYVILARYPGNPAVIASLQVAGPSVVVPAVPTGTYLVTVVAVNAAGVSPESSAIAINVP